ncbi:hypothetical protein AB6818_07410 [Carnobacterium maltaromaticum]|uniref:hypothetical protein n=1 Tax=Carnobacterium maltaromaticum TaxID=2751 RepID=UPI0039BDAE56
MKKIIIACSLVLLMASGCSLTQKDESKKIKETDSELVHSSKKKRDRKKKSTTNENEKKIPLFKIKKKQTLYKLVKCWGIHLGQILQRLTKK